MMRRFAATGMFAAAIFAAAPALAGYHYQTIDGPASALLLGTVVTGLNDAGVGTGYYVTYDPSVPPGALGDYTGFTVNADGSNFQSLSRPGAAQTGASGINNAGDVVGVSVDSANNGIGFLRSGTDGSYSDIDPSQGGIASFYSEANGINNFGAIVGFYDDVMPPSIADIGLYAHGFIKLGSVYQSIDVPAAWGFGTQAFTINDFGLVTGSFFDNSPDHNTHGFIYDIGSAAFFQVPELLGSPGSSIGNITSQLTTTYNAIYPNPMSPLGYFSLAFVLSPGGLTPINAPGAFFTNAFSINEAGQVSGLYVGPTGIHGFIATPVPEPANWALLIAGFGLTGAAMRRRRAPVAA